VFIRGRLTRQRGVDPRPLTFAVLDFETTDLYPEYGARVCEIGIVRMRGDGLVLDEYSTLINPELSITNDKFHGITDAHVTGAPTFAQVAGDVLAYLDNAIVVGHKLEFEEKFLAAELGRIGVTLRGTPGVCTLVTARTQLEQYGYSLDSFANAISGEWPAALHSALGDARALALTLAKLINEAPRPLYWAGPPPGALPVLPRSGIVAPRAAGLRRGAEGWLATLTARLPYMTQAPQPRPEGVRDYKAMLGHALADGKIVGEEAAQLAVLAARAGLTQTTARQVHDGFLVDARARAEADGVVTSTELKELQRAAKELAASHLISDLEAAAAANRAKQNGPLKGWRILPVGDSPAVTEVVDFAVEQGAKVAVNITRTVRMVIAERAAEDDPRVVKARGAGIEVVTPDQARTAVDAETAKSGGLFTDPDGEQVAERLAAEQAAATRGKAPEWHEFWRPRELTPAEYQAMFVDRRDDWDDYDRDEIVVRVPVAASRASASPQATSGKGGGCATAAAVVGVLVLGVVELIRQLIG
jgi:DNA polymerase-3 subunit epsilon